MILEAQSVQFSREQVQNNISPIGIVYSEEKVVGNIAKVKLKLRYLHGSDEQR